MKAGSVSVGVGAALGLVLSLEGCQLFERRSEPPPTPSVTVITEERASQTVQLADVSIEEEGAVSGVLINDSDQFIHNIRVLVRHAWRWKNERKPGTDNPSRAGAYIVRNDVPPGGSLPFKYKPDPPLPKRKDGHFDTTVDILGFSEVE